MENEILDKAIRLRKDLSYIEQMKNLINNKRRPSHNCAMGYLMSQLFDNDIRVLNDFKVFLDDLERIFNKELKEL